MQKLYENFHIFHFQKRTFSAETIRGNTVVHMSIILVSKSHLICLKRTKNLPSLKLQNCDQYA